MGYQNFFAAKLANDIGAGDTSIELDTAPSKTSGRLVLEARNPTQREVVKYTGLAGTTITGVSRGQGGTSAKSHTKNSLVEMNLTAEDIEDLYTAWNAFLASNDDWRPLLANFTVATGYNKGNNEAVIDVNQDLTAVLAPGMRLKLTRGTTPPTQSADLERSSSQYASRVAASVAGMTQTDDITVEAWIKPESYGTNGGDEQVILGRRTAASGGNGWSLRLNNAGQLEMIGLNAGNNRMWSTYQAIPIGEWVHVAVNFDMSGFTTATNKMYINGVSVPIFPLNTGAPTSFVQGGDLKIGAEFSGRYFDGKIADVRYWSSMRTETQIRDNMNQQLTGGEAGLVGYWKLDNSWNDSTANANHLSAIGGAGFSVDNPMKAIEYAIITAISPTQVTVFSGNDQNIPNMTLSSPEYSMVKRPFGFPSAEKFDLNYKWVGQGSSAFSSCGTGTGNFVALTAMGIQIPTGIWDLDTSMSMTFHSSVAHQIRGYTQWAKSGTTPNLTTGGKGLSMMRANEGTTQYMVGSHFNRDTVKLDAPETWNYFGYMVGNGTQIMYQDTSEYGALKLRSAYI